MFIIGISLDFLDAAAKAKRESWFMSIWQIAALTDSYSVHSSSQTLIEINLSFTNIFIFFPFWQQSYLGNKQVTEKVS